MQHATEGIETKLFGTVALAIVVTVRAVDGDAEKTTEGHLLRGQDPKHPAARAQKHEFLGRPRPQVLQEHPRSWFRGEEGMTNEERGMLLFYFTLLYFSPYPLNCSVVPFTVRYT